MAWSLRRPSRLAAAALLPLAMLVPTAAAEDAKPAGEPKPAPAAPAPTRRKLELKERERLLPLLRSYLEIDSDIVATRLALIRELNVLRDAGADVLADRETLTSLLYAARPFQRVFDKADKTLIARDDKTSKIVADPATGVVSVVLADHRLSLLLPKEYAELAKAKKLNARAPYPMIVTLHDLEDFQEGSTTKEFPGAEVIRRRWERKSNPITEKWIVLAPVATRARFVEERVHAERIPLRSIWSRYHVDFDRIVLDGGQDALLVGASQPNFYAGLIVRGDNADIAPELVVNLEHLPIYVVGTDAAAVVKTLKGAGYPEKRLQVGPASGLAEWLASPDVRRTVPKSFRWSVKDRDSHAFAHWINLEQIEAGATDPNLKVDVVDTPDDPNTIRISSNGVRAITLFLSDAVVNLDKPVRLVVNGTPVKEVRLPHQRKPEGVAVTLPAKFDRTADGMLDGPELSLRVTQYYVWQFPVIMKKLAISTDAADKEKADKEKADKEKADKEKEGAEKAPNEGDTPVASDDEAAKKRIDDQAKIYFAKAEELERAGNGSRALDLYRKAVAAGESSVKLRAEAKVKELEAKSAAATGTK